MPLVMDHYWGGGYRGGYGQCQYVWDSGEPFDFHDFIGNPGEPYIHLTPGNNYLWSTGSDKNDQNNGCLCKSQQSIEEERVIESSCPPGWSEMANTCILLLKPEDYPEPCENCNCCYGGCEWEPPMECTVENCYIDYEAQRWWGWKGYRYRWSCGVVITVRLRSKCGKNLTRG